MSVFQTDPDTGELIRTAGTFVRVEGIEEILVCARTALRLERGEVLLDQTRGMRYAGLVLEKGTPPSRVEGEFVDQLLRVAGISAVFAVNLTPNYAERTATVDIEVEGSVDDLRARIPIQDRFQIDIGG